MASKNDKRPLSLRYLQVPGRTSPPSIPLILPSSHVWDPESGKVIPREPKSKPPVDLKLVIVEEAVDFLRTIDKPLAVLSICGPYRSGKSYFLSRLLGDELFKVGHTMKACTIGLWISTAILEGEDYSVLLVDTQGIDSTNSTEVVGNKLMSITALLSSYLIYNSKRIPSSVDVEKLRICCLISSSVLGRVTKKDISQVPKCFFPHFLWLLRDVRLQMTDKTGNPLEPTQYLHTCVLKTKDEKQSFEATKLICNFFSSLECRTLSQPSNVPDVLHDIFRQQERLRPKFSHELSNVLEYIKESICCKRSIDGRACINGVALTELVSNFVEIVNLDSLPDFQKGWMAVVQERCSEITDDLLAEYKNEMNGFVANNSPQEEKELMEKHKEYADSILAKLEERLLELDPLCLVISRRPVLDNFKLRLAEYDESNAVVGGALHSYVNENYLESRIWCESVWKRLLVKYDTQKKFDESVQAAHPVDVMPDLTRIQNEYLESAIGPAKFVLEETSDEYSQKASILRKIPGKPRDFKVIGRAYNKVKLSWLPPLENPENPEDPKSKITYHVHMRIDGGRWEEVKTTSKTKALITKNIIDSAKYGFSVVATNELLHGLDVCNSAVTKLDGTKEFLVNLVSGAVPAIAAVNHFTHEQQRGREVSSVKAASVIALTTLLTPVTMIGFPLSGPLLAISLANDDQLRENCRSEGDLTPEDD